MQLTATYSLKPDALEGTDGGGSGTGTPESGGPSAADGGRALGSRVGFTGSNAQADVSAPMIKIIDAKEPVTPGRRIAPPRRGETLHGAEERQ
ncbi:hypothetical protein GCM10009557_55130 [Virgisporangium ochraceum]|uniref:Uncharacterized protein n=1 Tax=Virgisporangium ochraceum TaxID=65505 RepID=A0A8J3ZLH4_9ACTN|nr:hypothetical protein Voc01_009910 [Virgisporangium ochraceum]